MVEQAVSKLQQDQLIRLAQTLRELEERYRCLLGVLLIRKEQVRRGETKMLNAGQEDERACLQRIAELDELRGQLVSELAGSNQINGPEISIDAVLPLADAGLARDLHSARVALRKTLQTVQAEYAVLQQVGESLFAHVTSLLQRIRTFGVGSAVYSRNGRVNGNRPLISGVDLRT